MWITFSLFLQYSYVSALVQCENHSHNDKSFPTIPNMQGSIGPKWFGFRPPYNSGSVHATISATWIIICFTIFSNTYKHWLQTTSFSVFIEVFRSLIAKHKWRHDRHNHGHRRRNWPPSAPHKALRSAMTLSMIRLQPPKLANGIFGGVEGVYGPKSTFWLDQSYLLPIIHTKQHQIKSPPHHSRTKQHIKPHIILQQQVCEFWIKPPNRYSLVSLRSCPTTTSIVSTHLPSTPSRPISTYSRANQKIQ